MYPCIPAGKLTCAEFLTTYWEHIQKLQLYRIGKLDEHKERIDRDKRLDLLI